MNAIDRRRVVVASVFTVVALPALWALNRDSAASSVSPNVGAAGVEVGAPALETAPTTSAYRPEPPLFVGGDDEPVPPGVIDVAVPPTPGTNELLARATFRRYGAASRQCTTLLAPDGAALTVVNLDNGQSTTCTNTLGVPVPAGTDLVLDTVVFSEIGDLADAPVPVRVSW
jgi:hypothetical protein